MQSRLFLEGPQPEHQYLHERAAEHGEHRRPTKRVQQGDEERVQHEGRQERHVEWKTPKATLVPVEPVRRVEERLEERRQSAQHRLGHRSHRQVCIAHATMAATGAATQSEKAQVSKSLSPNGW